MPELRLIAPAVDSFQLKNSRVTVVMRRSATGADHDQATHAVIGEGYNARHAYRRFLCYLAASLIVSWDATRPNDQGEQEAIPVSPQTLSAMENDEDYEQLMAETDQRAFLGKTTPKKKAPSETSSLASSRAMNRRTRKSSPAPST